MAAIGYVGVSTDKQADHGVSLDAQDAKIRAIAIVQGVSLLEIIVDGGESAKSLNRPGLRRLLSLVNSGSVQAVIVAKLDRLTRSVKDLCGLLELFEKKNVAPVSVAESLDTGTAELLNRMGRSTQVLRSDLERGVALALMSPLAG
jgi:site-specific DNA recombinase